ncbi:MAG: NAD(P)H-dependent oxidoreductase [Saprospiraceae bacterium]|jgi:NAD(P)H-dependent FMN reductase|nr:NAD(P)H-dependent oxidoreductase [Saprospiraceae bacterium]MBK6481172.1 NAD(P)H-dependent oxidoreductase [Saprospiraceae bacterium]MBK7370930.1 NAD(P)H-dependent oxidoreductase [Saprospiraceae bacterium]MBK7436556.1 NAD(P)H-dependent oxidoreductase [Saprospiraceae bacterium]MBK7609296.1 NAD(P)H-dependent oxidoreductase [Saprospiraceae bacterium]
MLLIIHGTNRQASQSKPISDFVFEYSKSRYEEKVELLDLTNIKMNAFESVSMYEKDTISAEITHIKDTLLIPSTKMVFIAPEYNGSFPGILKLFIDACSVKDARDSFYHKKACLIGVASGRAGNLRGMDHLTSILMYMNMIVFPNRLPISKIESLLNAQNQLVDPTTQHTLGTLLDDFIRF